jgi:tRNA dimethylallyltransferase
VPDVRPDVVAVVGPTAAGKSEAALRIAEALGGEVVNADSMQLYRGMDVGTAKLTIAERRGVEHHLLDVWDVRTTANVAAYQTMARAVIDDLRSRGTTAVVAGGSGLYVRGALDAIEFPGTDPAIRARLEAELDDIGPERLYERLQSLDPVAAQRIQPANGRRTVRALEVVELTGRPFSEGPGMLDYTDVYDTLHLGLVPDMQTLDERIEHRVDVMWERGLVAEVTALSHEGLREGVTARRALGYRQVLAYLAGETTEETAKESTKQATRRFARRQLSWFRRDPRIAWYATPEQLVTAATRPNG